jgi:hypothetical protein
MNHYGNTENVLLFSFEDSNNNFTASYCNNGSWTSYSNTIILENIEGLRAIYNTESENGEPSFFVPFTILKGVVCEDIVKISLDDKTLVKFIIDDPIEGWVEIWFYHD